MKKIICAILCLSIVLTGIIGITAASAETKTESYSVKVQGNGTYRYAEKGTTSIRSGYRSVYVTLNLNVTFERGPGMSDEGTWYSASGSDSASASGNRVARSLFASASARNANDFYKRGSAGGTIAYTR